MSEDTQIITVHQYNRYPIMKDDMDKLLEIAKDYREVKQYVYHRYGGIRSLEKLNPGYVIQNEMTKSGLRCRLEMPSAYFYAAIYAALADIKAGWTIVHKQILKRIKENPYFTVEERHYLRFCLKMESRYVKILNHTAIDTPAKFENLDIKRLHNYLCRQTRKYLKIQETDKVDGFRIGVKAYRYEDGGIYISTKESRKRVFIPLTDRSRFSKQLYIRLRPEENRLVIDAPVEIKKKRHPDFKQELGLAYGYYVMFTSSNGMRYGEKLGEYERAESERVRASAIRRNAALNVERLNAVSEIKAENIRTNNIGNHKYREKRRRYLEFIKSYINEEINRLIEVEKPSTIYLPKLPSDINKTQNKQLNYNMTMWRRGYIRKRLLLKCALHSIDVVEVFGKDISRCCCVCHKTGEKKDSQLICSNCGIALDEKINSARNALYRGQNVPL